jgi:hypothetical protein
LLEGYAGFFDPSTAEITMSEDLDDQTILHEASHAWFHGGFLTDRWITEGLAEHYADRVRETLGLSDEFDPDAIARTAKGEFPLNRWPNPERIDDQETQDQETYGYRASYTVIRRIAEAIGDDGMRAVLAAVDRGESAYVGDGRPDRTGATMDWKRFLDLVQDVGGMTDADDLFAEWAVSGSETGLLRSRELARADYAELEEAGHAWAVPKGARAMMSLWRFADATAMFDAAEPVLALRDDLAALTTDLALTPPADVESRFEDAAKIGDLATIGDTLEARIAAARDVAGARDALAAERPPLVVLGLIGETPDTSYGSARAAFEAGDVAAATAASAATVAVLAGAESAGATRALVIGGVAVALLVLLVIAVALVVRGRRRRRLALGAASASASTTLPATSAPVGAPPVVPPTPPTSLTPREPAAGAEPD